MCVDNKGMDSKAVRHLQRACALTESLMRSESTSSNQDKHQNKQNLFSDQMKLGFGTEGPIKRLFRQASIIRQNSIKHPIDTIDLLNDEALGLIMKNLEVSDLKKASLTSKKIRGVALGNIKQRLKEKVSELVTDDQNLINAIQDRHDKRANTLLQYRRGTPPIDKSAIQHGQHADVIRKIVAGALATKREITLALDLDFNPITQNNEDLFIVTVQNIEDGVIYATANETSTTQKIKKDETLEISIVTEQGVTKTNKNFTRVMYKISKKGSLLWSSSVPGRRRRGKLTLGQP